MADDFDWNDYESGDIVVQSVQAVAVYANPRGNIVIRQERDYADESDSFVFVPLDRIEAVIERMREVQRELLASKAKSND